MPKNRRNRSSNRGGNDRAKLRMDDVRGGVSGRGARRDNDQRRGRRSSNSPRRRELGHVMQSARRDAGQSAYWTKKLLEVEARVPDRWRHSGFDEMYREELRKSSRSRSSSSSSRSSRSRSPIERPKSPINRRPRTPVKVTKDKNQKTRPRSPPSPPSRHSDSRERSRGRPRTPAHRRSGHRRANNSSSFSSSGSESSCSDDDCSICTPKHRKQQRNSRTPPPPTPPPIPKKTIKRVVNNNNKKTGRKTPPEPNGGRKKQRVGRPKSPPHPRTPIESSTGSSSSSSDSEDSSGEINEAPKMTLSERFGKMAQWSVDRREYDSVSMKITKDSAAPGMKVVIAEDAVELDFPLSRHERPVARRESPERDYAFHYERRRCFFERTYTEDRPPGPDAPVNWSDPLIRYSYYRRKGLLWETDVSFDEYFKWETWWQRYQEWLDVERACYGEDAAVDNARRERERDWESYRFSNLGRSPLERETLPLPRNEPWLTKRSGIGKNVINKGAEGFVTRKFLRT